MPPACRPARLRATLRLAPLVAGLLVATTACFTGPRPTLGGEVDVGGAPGSETDDANVDAVLELLEAAGETPFTANYTITRKLGSTTSPATVATDGAYVTTTVGDVRFFSGDEELTCSVSEETCEEGLLDERISDVGLANTFWGISPARALRVAAQRRSAPTTASTRTIGGQPATCVEVPVGGGTETYCAVTDGPVALWDTAATRVELTSLSPDADPDAFIPPG